MGLMARSQAFLTRTLGVAAGVSVVYARGLEAVTLTAVPGLDQRDETIAVSDRTRRDHRERDYLIAPADLRRAGFDAPQTDDTITEVLDGCEVTFRVTPRDTAPPWVWSDLERTRYRVHCVRK